MELPPRPKPFDFHGVSMTNYFTDNWENVQNFKARPDDILIATYPKAGIVKINNISINQYGQMLNTKLYTVVSVDFMF